CLISYLGIFLFLCCSPALCDLHSFPTRRTSDLLFVVLRTVGKGHLTGLFIDNFINSSGVCHRCVKACGANNQPCQQTQRQPFIRSEEHMSELQSRENLVCRLLLEQKKILRLVQY